MNRFFVSRELIKPPEIRVTDKDDVRHMCRALRVSRGEVLFITDGEGAGYLAGVERIGKSEILLAVKKEFPRARREDQKVRFSLACAVPKFARFEEVVEKGTQLGADEIIPLVTERTLLKKNVFDKKLGRMRRISLSAAKQSGVLFLPRVFDAQDFHGLIRTTGAYGLKLIPNLSETPMSVKKAVENFTGGRILVLIGPEGDFTRQELDAAFGAGFCGVTLGTSVLKVDAAAIAVMSFLRMHFDL